MATWEEIQKGIFAGESGGDYDALFNFQNKDDGLFSDVKITEMSINEALEFADPQGEYGKYVALQNNGEVSTPMGAYQIVGSTLRDAKNALNLSGDEKLTPAMQDKIAKWILKTQGTKAWAGYKGEEVRAGDNSMALQNRLNALQMQQASRRPGGLMGIFQQTADKLKNIDLSSAQQRAVLGSFSRSPVGRRLQAINTTLAGQEMKMAADNRTAQYLASQPGGKNLAQAILNKQLTGEQALEIHKKGTLSLKDQQQLLAKTKSDFMGLGRVKEFDKVTQAYGRIAASSIEPSAAGDLSLIFNYMKMLDPGSVVRESEFRSAAAAGNYGERLKGFMENLAKGTLLTAVQRADFVDRATRLYKAAENGYDNLRQQYVSDAIDLGLDGDIIPDIRYSGKDPTTQTPLILNVPANPNKNRYPTDAEWIEKWQKETEQWRKDYMEALEREQNN